MRNVHVCIRLRCAAKKGKRKVCVVKRTKLVSLLLVALLLLGVCSGCAKKQETGELPVIRVAIQPYLCSLPVVYMMDNGLDEANGFKIEASTFTVGTLMTESLVADEWDLATTGASGVYMVANNGAIVIGDIELCSGGTGAFVKSDSPVAQVQGVNPDYPTVYGDPESVKGMQIVLPTGSLNHLNVLKWLDVIGLEPGDVEIVNMDNSSGYQAFVAGQADMTACSPPLSFTMSDEGYVNVGSLVDLEVDLYDLLVANGNSYADPEMRELMVKFCKVFYEVCDELAQDPERTAELELQWQTDNGMESNIENALLEVESRPFVTLDELKDHDHGAAVIELAEFYVSVEKLEESQLEIFNEETLTKDIINEAFGY